MSAEGTLTPFFIMLFSLIFLMLLDQASPVFTLYKRASLAKRLEICAVFILLLQLASLHLMVALYLK